VEGRALEPHLVAIRCPNCRKRIYLVDVTDEQRARDAESDALDDES